MITGDTSVTMCRAPRRCGGLGVSDENQGRQMGRVGRFVAAIVAEAALLVVLWTLCACAGVDRVLELGWWVSHTDPTTAVLARFGSGDGGVGVDAGVDGGLSGGEYGRVGAVVRGSGWVTLPVIRRMVDGVAAASILASALASSASASSGLAARAPAVVHAGASFARPMLLREFGGEAAGDRRGSGVGREVLSGGGSSHSASGVVEHAVLASYRPPTVPASGVPSEANGFAGLAPGTKVVVVRPATVCR